MNALTKLCDRCKRRIKSDALACVCGWSAVTFSQNSQPHIPCCFSGCPENAVAKVWTKTGWAKVCEKDYPKLKYVPRPAVGNSVVDSIRKAYEKSHMYRRQGGGHVSKLLPKMREPGQDFEEDNATEAA